MSNVSSHTSDNSSSHPHASAPRDKNPDDKTSRVSAISKKSAEEADQTPWHFMADIGRQQLAAATQYTSAMYRGSENLRKIQQDIAHQASTRHAEAAKKLFSPCDPSDVLPIQSELLRADLQSASQYWQQLTGAALQAQREMMDSMSKMLDSNNGSGMKSALEAFQASVPALASSFFVDGSNRQNEQKHDS